MITVLSLTVRFDNPDLWLHLRIGKEIWTTRSIPSTDIFSFSAAGRPWTAHEWLWEFIMYAAYQAGGYVGVMLWVSVFASLIFLLVYALCMVLTGNALVS